MPEKAISQFNHNKNDILADRIASARRLCYLPGIATESIIHYVLSMLHESLKKLYKV